MDRNRDRRSIMAASANGLSRRRHRSSSLRESPDEDRPVEYQEPPTRFRDRGVKKDRDRDRSSRQRKRRGDRSINGSNRDDSSEESSSGDGDDDGGSVFSAVSHNHHQARESFYEDSRPATTWRPPANELIGFSVPRKARSASTKRSYENWVSGNGVGGDQVSRHSSASPSPVRPAVPSPVSPTSSSASARKKMVNKVNGTKQRPPKSTAKASSPKPEDELEKEIAEVLYGLKTQSHGGSSKKDSVDMREVRSKSDGKSGVPSSISDSTSTAPENRGPSSVPLSAIAPKRKRPRQVSEDLGSPGVAQSSISSITDSKINTEPGLEEKQSGSGAGSNEDFTGRRLTEPVTMDSGSVVTEFKPVTEEDSRDIRDVGQGEKEEAITTNESIVAVVTPKGDCDDVKATLAKSFISGMVSQQEERLEIDLMAPPPQSKSSPERDDYDAGGDEAEEEEVHRDRKKAKVMADVVEQDKAVLPEDIETSLQLDLGKHERDEGPGSGNEDSKKLHPHLQLQNPQAKPVRDEHSMAGNTVQCSSIPMPLSLASWPNGFPPIGYAAPLQGAPPVGGNAVAPLVQPLFSRPRSKRCATHCHIARTIHYQQQFMKMNPFWPGAATPIFDGKACNVNVLQTGELQRSLNTVPDRNQGVSVLPSDNGREKGSQALNLTDPQRKQHVVFQQALPAGVSPNSVMPVPAFVFPMNHQQPVVAAQPGSVKLPSGLATVCSTNMSNPVPASGSATASPQMSFNYQNMPSNNSHQYVAILPNNPYPFPIPASGAPPAFGGVAHAQPIPYFNGSFYPSQLIHPMQIQQQQPSSQQGNQNTSISSASTTLQKQQQKQQHQQQQRSEDNTPSTADSHSSRFPSFSQNFAANFALAAPPPNAASHGAEKKTQQAPQQGMKQPFTMSFATMNGADASSMSGQNNTGLQSLPEAARNGYNHQIMLAAASAQAAQQKRNSRLSEEGKSEGNSSSNVDGHKTSLGKSSTSSIAFSRSAMAAANAQMQFQLQFQQQILQKQQHQQQQQEQHLLAGRRKSLVPSSGSAQNDYLASSSPGIAKFPGVQNSSAAQWKSSVATIASEVASSLAPARNKSHSQPPQVRTPQNPTQISFLTNQQPSGTVQASNHPSHSSPVVVVGSPSNSLTKDGGGSPKSTSFNSSGNRSGQPSTYSSSQQSRNSSPVGNRNTQSILGSPHIFPSNTSARPQMQQQSQLRKQQMEQAQLMFSLQAGFQPNSSSSAAAAASSYYMQRWRPEQHQSSHPGGSTTTTSPSVVKGGVSSNVKAGGLGSQGSGVSPLFAPPGFSYHAVPAAGQLIQKEHKPAA